MVLQGFDKDYYLQAKLDALVASGKTEWVGKDADFLEAVLGNVYGLTPEDHYSQYGYAEGLAPNACFNAAEYTLAKATQLFNSDNYMTIEDALADYEAKWPGDDYQHYLQYGSAEGINPSNAFDESSYLDSKLAALQADPDTSVEWADKTADDVQAAFTAAGLTVLGHYIAYGKDEGIAVTPVPTDEQVDVDASGVVGETFILTSGIDTIVGTADDDIIKGLVDTRDDISTLNNNDTINGGTGNDILDVTMDGNLGDAGYASTATVMNVESVKVSIGSGGALNFDTRNFSGLEKVVADESIGTVTFDNVQDKDIELVVSETQAGARANYKASQLVGDDDTANITIENVLAGAIRVGAQGGSTAASGFETIALTSQGVVDRNTIASITETGIQQADTLTVAGTNDLTIINALNAAFETVNASTLEGGLTATVLANRATINGGLGDDVITMTGAVPESTVDLGTGDDRLGINSQNVDLGDADISNVETLRIQDVTWWPITHTVDFADFTVDAVQVIDAFAPGGTLTLSNYDNAVPLAFLEDYAGTVVVQKVTADDTNADSLSVSMEGDRGAQNGVVNAALTISDVETLNIDSSQEDMLTGDIFNVTGDISTLTVNDASTELEEVVLTGTGRNTSVTLTGFDKDLKTIDAGEMTGNLSMDISAAAADIAYTGAQGDDLIDFGAQLTSADSINAGEGDDEVRADLGATAVTIDSDSVETISVESTNPAARLNLNKALGLTGIIIEDSWFDLTLDKLAADVTITMEDGLWADLDIIDAQEDLAIAMVDTDGVWGNGNHGTIDVGSDVKTLALSYTDDDSTTTQTVGALEGSALKTLNLSVTRGDTLTINGILGSDGIAATTTDLTPSLITINGADSKGAINLTVNNIEGEVTTGIGDDSITLAQALTSAMTVDAGDQDDAATLFATSASNDGDVLTFMAADSVSAADMANITGFETYVSGAGALTLTLTEEAVATAADQTVAVNGKAAGALTLDLSDLTSDQVSLVTGLNAADEITIGAAADTVDVSAVGGTIIITDVDDMSGDTLTGADAVASSTLQFTDGIDRDTAIDISSVEGFDTMLLKGTQQEYKFVLTNDLLNDSGVAYAVTAETLSIDASDAFILNLDASAVKDATVLPLPATYAACSYDIAVIGSDNNDIVIGTANDDIIGGGSGNDYLTGGKGADTLTGGVDKDTLTGDAGSDSFVIANADSGVTTVTADVITDFVTAVDSLDMATAGIVGNFFALETDAGVTDEIATVELAVAAANAAAGPGTSFDGTVQYIYAYDSVGGVDAYLVADNDLDGTADFAIELTGLGTNTAGLVVGDIV